MTAKYQNVNLDMNHTRARKTDGAQFYQRKCTMLETCMYLVFSICMRSYL
jgi:hypothetical protein